jgi:hypothetical protein
MRGFRAAPQAAADGDRVGIFAAVLHGFEAETGAIQVTVLWPFLRRQLRKTVNELHHKSSQEEGSIHLLDMDATVLHWLLHQFIRAPKLSLRLPR